MLRCYPQRWRLVLGAICPAQPTAGTYHNPIMGGDHPDASPIRVGDDLSHPLQLRLRARAADLALARPHQLAPGSRRAHRYYGGVWAPYLCEYEKRFYIYFPAESGCTSSTPIIRRTMERTRRSWHQRDRSAHIAENGRRFLYMSGGQMAELTADGLAVKTAAA